MKKVDFKSEAPSAAYPMLPVGAYVCGITNVKVDGEEPDQALVLRLDIIEGEYTGYFTKRYQHDANNGGQYAAKYKGDFRIQIPNPDNVKRQHPEWDQKTLNNSIWCIETSNPGFHWDGEHEMQLKGKTVGINVREGVYQGNVFTQIGRLENVDNVRKGLVKPMKPRTDNSSLPQATPAVSTDPQSGFTMVETEELPF